MSMDHYDLMGDPDSVSNCCGARVTSSGMCADCGEHCTDERDEPEEKDDPDDLRGDYLRDLAKDRRAEEESEKQKP